MLMRLYSIEFCVSDALSEKNYGETVILRNPVLLVMPPETASNTCLPCILSKVCDYDLIGGGDPIGKIKLGWNQSKEYKPGFKHWKEVLENPRRPIIKWHVLQVRNFATYISILRKFSYSHLYLKIKLNVTLSEKLCFITHQFYSNLGCAIRSYSLHEFKNRKDYKNM